MFGNVNGKNVFSIPVEWTVTETLQVKADTLEDAVKFIQANSEKIPLGDDPMYLDGSWKISADEANTGNIKDICEILTTYGFVTERSANEFDSVDSI